MVREKSGSAFRNVLSKNVRKRTKTVTGCSRFIEGQNVISTNIEICPGLHANAKIAILAKNRKNRKTPKS